MFNSIVVPLDGSTLSERVLGYVELLARRLRLPVRLVQAVSPVENSLREELAAEMGGAPGGAVREIVSAGSIDKLATSERSEARTYLTTLEAELREAGVPAASSVAREGDPANVILAEARAYPGSLIAMSTRGKSGLARLVSGSVTRKVLESAASPVLALRPGDEVGEPADIRSIIVPLDESPESEGALPRAIQLSRAFDARIRLITVNPSPAQVYAFAYAGPMSMPPPDIPETIDAQAEAYIERVRWEVASEVTSPVEAEVLHGGAARAISDAAKAEPGSLVVMVTHAPSGVTRWLPGSVADEVIRDSQRPVLAIRAPEAEYSR